MIFSRISSTFLLCLLGAFSPLLHAAHLQVIVSDTQAIALEDAVVELISDKNPKAAQDALHYEMAQKNRTFIPFVMAVPQGTKVDFPNLDRTRHHVYSFSEAKPFELKLYVGKAEEPILFDQPGLVALGCNIHDYMQAFIYVARSPLVAVSDSQGQIDFSDVPEGTYQVKLWHPWQKAVQSLSTLVVNAGDNSLSLSLDVTRQAKPSAPPAGFGNLDPQGSPDYAQ